MLANLQVTRFHVFPLAHGSLGRRRWRLAWAALAATLLSLSSCTAVHFRDGDGNLRHVGLVLQRDTELAAGDRTRVWSFGGSLWLLPECKGYALGLSWHEWEYPDVRRVDDGHGLQESVARAVLVDDDRPEPGPSSWRAGATTHAARESGVASAGSLGFACLAVADETTLVALYGERRYVAELGARWNTVLYRRDVAGSRHDVAEAWILASGPSARSAPPLVKAP